jgi:CHAT domain-containing protein/tetratricopeptide (TPR) repeat protein
MAIRSLCLILTLWMVSLRQPRAIPTGSPPSSKWWGSQATKDIRNTAMHLRERGDFAAVESLYQDAAAEAQRRRDPLAEMRFRMGVGVARLLRFDYRGALDAYLAAKRLGEKHGYREDLGAIAFNLSSLYQQVWDAESAARSAEEGYRAIAGLPGVYYRAELLLQIGKLRAGGGPEALDLLEAGLEAARARSDVGLEAQAWDAIGDQRLAMRRIAESEAAYVEAFRLRTLLWPTDLGLSYARLGAIRLEQGRLEEAARFTRQALRAGAGAFPPYRLRHQLGRIRLAEGDVLGALGEFEDAVRLAAEWNAGVLPSAAALTGANAELESRIFDTFVETAAAYSLRTGDLEWARKAFLAMEWNRAASLRQGIVLAEVCRDRLTPEFWRTLAQLRAEQTRLLRTSEPDSALARSLQLRLTEIEAQAGTSSPVDEAVNNIEIFPGVRALRHIQGGLGETEVLLSFYLGNTESYRWSATRSSLILERIGARGRIAELGRVFREAVQRNEPRAAELGAILYAELFGSLGREERSKPCWLLSLEGELFNLPYAALVSERRGSRLTYVVMGHTVQVVPGALSLNTLVRGGAGQQPLRKSERDESPARFGVNDRLGNQVRVGSQRRFGSQGWFLGVADPVYNPADPRWKGLRPETVRGPTEARPLALGRLVASTQEVAESARCWTAESGGVAVLLTGNQATKDAFLKQLGSGAPAVIHLATHVLAAPGRSEQAFIGFSAEAAGEPGLLTTADVSSLHVPGSLVVMSGCQTAAGKAQPGTGQLGLTRAWLLAGAGATIATLWPMSDSAGDFFPRFYHHLAHRAPAEALRQAQIEMAASGTWQAAPAFWAAFQVTGSER